MGRALAVPGHLHGEVAAHGEQRLAEGVIGRAPGGDGRVARQPKRAEDVINGIIAAYDIDAIDDKRAISNLTEKFIKERLSTLSDELNIADDQIANYKQEHRLYSPEDEATLSAEEIKRLKLLLFNVFSVDNK